MALVRTGTMRICFLLLLLSSQDQVYLLLPREVRQVWMLYYVESLKHVLRGDRWLTGSVSVSGSRGTGFESVQLRC